jgi:hypothetical protein
VNAPRIATAALLGLVACAWGLGAETPLQRAAGALVFLAWAVFIVRPDLVSGRWLEALAVTGILVAPLGPGFLATGGLLAAPWGARSGARSWRRLQRLVQGGPA